MADWSDHGSSNTAQEDAELRSPSLRGASAILETEVLPRLLMLHRAGQGAIMQEQSLAVHGVTPLPPKIVVKFVDMLIESDVDAGSAFIKRLRRSGVPERECLLSVMAPAARELGQRWSDDRATFNDVTIGLGCLQMILRREFGESAHNPEATLPFRGRFFAAPGEQHTLGILIVERHFRERGWCTTGGQPSTWNDIRGELRHESYDVIAVSVSNDRHLSRLAREINSLRKSSSNPDVKVILGGSAVRSAESQAGADRFGADLVAGDGTGLVQAVERLLGYHELTPLPV